MKVIILNTVPFRNYRIWPKRTFFISVRFLSGFGTGLNSSSLGPRSQNQNQNIDYG
jgi:hypothetical protein